MIRLHDSATGQIRELALREPGKVSLYVCGPTVYGPPHLGHGRFTLTYDVLRRYLRWCGLEVTFVSNITDIDDNILQRAEREQRPWQDIAQKCEAVWWKAMDAMGIERPDHTPHATDFVAEMTALVQQFVSSAAAYVTSDGVYLSVEAVPDYGLLAHQSVESMLAGGGERTLVGDEKRHPADFALWKFSKPGEPAWPAPFGDGRPGWHTECVVMSLGILGEGFDLHTGGQDLRFPHHENERAQAVVWGKDFAHHWMHNGFVVDKSGEKMSKSLDNFTNLLDLIETVDPRAYRMLVLQSHYRSPVTVDKETIGAAEVALERIDSLARRHVAIGDPDPSVLAAFRVAMDDDLNTPKAMEIVFDTIRAANANADSALVSAVASMLSAVGLVAKVGAAVPETAMARAAELDAARAAKDFAVADSIRAELQGQGFVVETTTSGTTLR